MLYSVLGKSIGRGPEDDTSQTQLFEKIENRRPTVIDRVESNPDIPALDDIARVDPEFSVSYFLDGAKQAYAMVLESFAEGDRETLKSLLTPSVYEIYAGAISERESKNLTQVTDLAGIMDADIIAAEKTGSTACISVKYNAELSSALLDADGQAVKGDLDILSSVSEVWTFERDLKSPHPDWLLGDVAPAEGGDPEADPSPNTTFRTTNSQDSANT